VLDQIGSPEEVYRLAPDFHEKYVPHKLRMMRADDFISRVNGKRSLEEIAQLAGMDTFEVCKIAAALQLLSLLQRNTEPLQMTLTHAAEPASEEPLVESRQLEEVAAESFDEPFSIAEGEATEPAFAGVHATAGREEMSLGEILEIPSVQQLQASEPEGVVFHEEPASSIGEEQAGPAEPERVVNEVIAPVEENKEELAAPTLQEFEFRPQYEEEEELVKPAGRRRVAAVIATAIVIVGSLISGWFYFQKISRASLTPMQPPAVRSTRVEQKPAPVSSQQPEMSVATPALEPVQPVTTKAAPVPEPDNAPEIAKPSTAPSPAEPATSFDGVGMIGAGRIAEAAQNWKTELSSHPRAFVVQILIACQQKTITDTLALVDDKSNFRVLPLDYHGQACYRVLIGPFTTSEEAQSARNKLPATLLQQPSPPQVISLGQILK
jgi:septal ring-binding cell division protein DamX